MSQECQQPQAHPARCGCEEKKSYPDRLCHADYTAHPYRCGCLKGDAEAQRRFDEHQDHGPVPPAGGEVEIAARTMDGRELVDRAHVTRLQAKNAELQQRLLLMGQKVQQSDQILSATGAREAALQQRLTIADQRVDDLEFDIAAARELLKHGSSPTPAHCESVLDFLSGQSAPAAKGEEPLCLLCLDEKTVPGPKAGDFVRDCPDCCGDEG